MKKFTVIIFMIFAFALLAAGQEKHADKTSALKEALTNLEKQSWEAWKNRNGEFFKNFLSEDHVEISAGGTTDKATVAAGVASPACVVKSYRIDKFQLTLFNKNTALLTYYAEQDTLCGNVAVPSPVWVSSLYVKRKNRWLNSLYQQSPANKLKN